MREVEPVPAVADRFGPLQLVAPADAARGKGAEQDLAQLTPVDFGVAPAVLRRRAVEHDAAVPGDQPHLLTLGPGEVRELVPQLGGPQRVLAGVGLHVESAALVTDGS